MIPRLAKFISLGGVTYFAEAPVSPGERTAVRALWLDGNCIEPGIRGHRMFDQYPCALEEAHAAGLRGWWE